MKKQKYIKILAATVIMTSTLGVISVGSSSVSAQQVAMDEKSEVVHIPDSILRKNIKAKLGIVEDSEITKARLATITYMETTYAGIQNLSGLEYLTNLREIWLDGNQISDISPLGNLPKLQTLKLPGNKISDVSGLTNLPNLQKLELSENQIQDISSLAKANLLNLTALSLNSNQIKDVSPLGKLTKLTELGLYGNQITDVSPLKNLTRLTGLNIGGNQVQNITPLADMKGLTSLFLSENQINDVSPLTSLTELYGLDLSGNQISDVSPLARLSKLIFLNLASNQITDVSPLSDRTFNQLDVSKNWLSEIPTNWNSHQIAENFIDGKENQYNAAFSSETINLKIGETKTLPVNWKYNNQEEKVPTHLPEKPILTVDNENVTASGTQTVLQLQANKVGTSVVTYEPVPGLKKTVTVTVTE
ncbi:leucine-rich repeat domain-containing protein [Bacillus cereus]|uniref:Disease resistance R13L4/SHOC-2-like LRR domain-containing protein n=1 Tax=Bacillus cereus VD184 TaxID=1053242 RepID=A0A9W5R095_BACCE|nr:leucine-rich repeat domain-containing protein [Bacillus cereus]EOQ00367.1 hypothetical protein IKC_06624 [Bacillus cereus VD184]